MHDVEGMAACYARHKVPTVMYALGVILRVCKHFSYQFLIRWLNHASIVHALTIELSAYTTICAL